MNAGAWLAVGIGGLLLVAFAAVLFGAAGGATNTSEVLRAEPNVGSTPGPEDVVTSRHVRGGRSLFWISLSPRKYSVRVAFVLAPGCGDAIPQSGEELIGDGDCVPLAVKGTIAGSGMTAFGELIVLVDVPVTESCHQATVVGNSRLPLIDECQP